MELCGISLIFSRLFAKLFQVPRPLPKAATVGTDQTKTIQDRADINDANLAAPAQPSTMDDDFDIDIPLDDLKIFADFMQLTDRFKHLVRSANVELDLHQIGVLLPLIEELDCQFMRVVLKKRLANLAKTKPWEVLHFACEQDDLDMARTAISNLTTALIHKPAAAKPTDKNIWTKLSPLPWRWQLEFVRLYMHGTQNSGYGSAVGSLNENFAVWAKDFDPKKYEEGEGEGEGADVKGL